MTESFRPRPDVDIDSAPFWAAAREGRLLLQHCEACGHTQFYPRSLCSVCWSERTTWIESAGEGTVYSFSVVHRPAHEGFPVPYVVALVDLREGPRLPTNLVGIEPSEVTVDLPVVVDFVAIDDEISVPVFRPSARPAQ
jgi:uncharacterized OB-fold protein